MTEQCFKLFMMAFTIPAIWQQSGKMAGSPK